MLNKRIPKLIPLVLKIALAKNLKLLFYPNRRKMADWIYVTGKKIHANRFKYRVSFALPSYAKGTS